MPSTKRSVTAARKHNLSSKKHSGRGGEKPESVEAVFAKVTAQLRAKGTAHGRAALRRFGVTAAVANGVRASDLHRLARTIGRNRRLALRLWRSGIHGARHLACLVEDPVRVSEAQMERWARAFDSWSIVDCCCRYLFLATPFAWKKAMAWSRRRKRFVKRAAYVLMAYLAQHDRLAPAGKFRRLLPHIRRGADDERRAVKMAVNWALRQIGKRSPELNRAAITTARALAGSSAPAARWVGTNALRELTSPVVQRRLRGHPRQVQC